MTPPADYPGQQLLALTTPEYLLLATPYAWPESGAPVTVVVRRRSPQQWHGPVGRAILREALAGMRETWRHCAPGWGCGKQDRYGELMDAVEEDIRATGYTGPLG